IDLSRRCPVVCQQDGARDRPATRHDDSASGCAPDRSVAMRLVRFGAVGAERPGILTAAGEIRDLSAPVAGWGPTPTHPPALEHWRTLDLSSLPIVPDNVRLGVPWRGIGKFIAIGMNYRDFAVEANRSAPPEPVIFTKAISCINGPDDPVVLPPGSVKT